jgi:hypothetical protein
VNINGTRKEHNGKGSPAMTDFIRDLAAFASISMFVASLSIIVLGM